MSSRKKSPIEQIPVADQVGKRHVVVKYDGVVVPGVENEEAHAEVQHETEYRLTSGRCVTKTGADTFKTIDGRLWLRAL